MVLKDVEGLVSSCRGGVEALSKGDADQAVEGVCSGPTSTSSLDCVCLGSGRCCGLCCRDDLVKELNVVAGS